MAIRALNSVVVANYDVAATASWSAGAALARDAANPGKVVLAIRSAFGSSNFVGFSADDTARSGNTMILADPVGASYLDGSNVLQAANNGFYSVSKRAIGDFQSEVVNGVTNPSAQSSGYEGPRRGVGVYVTPGAQFVTDYFNTGAGSSAVNIFQDNALATHGAKYVPGTPLTFASDLVDGGTQASSNLGKLVECGIIPGTNALRGSFLTGFGGTAAKMVVGYVDRYDSAAGLLYFTAA